MGVYGSQKTIEFLREGVAVARAVVLAAKRDIVALRVGPNDPERYPFIHLIEHDRALRCNGH